MPVYRPMKPVLALVLFVTALLAGRESEASDPADRDSKELIPVTFYRDGGFGEVSPAVRVRIDGHEIGTLSRGDRKTVYAVPGSITVGVGAWGTERKYVIHIVAGGDQRFRIEATDRNQFAVRQSSPISR